MADMKPAPVQPMTLGNMRRNGVRALAAYAFAVMGGVRTPARELTVSGYFH
jgi:hypothetical protein